MFLDEFFYLHKSDRKVVLVLLCLAALFLAIICYDDAEPTLPAATDADTLSVARGDSLTKQPAPYYRTEARPTERFAFDPNTADSTQLLRLGLQPWQVRNIYKYRAAGGVYRRKEDFARLYGLTRKQYRELEPYIRISSDYLPASTLVSERATTTHHDTLQYPVKIHEGEAIDLSTADTSTLRRVPGIGSYYARRIAEYGERLGGYVSKEQLHEIDGFPVSSLNYFKVSTATPFRRINVNKLSVDQLKRHPYINYYQARAIVDYRRQQGPLKSLDELSLLPSFPPEAIARLRPYVEF